MKPNPGVQGRAARDTELEEIPRATIDAGRAKLAQKVVTYGQLKRGKSGGLNDKQMQELLVDVSPTTYYSQCHVPMVADIWTSGKACYGDHFMPVHHVYI